MAINRNCRHLGAEKKDRDQRKRMFNFYFLLSSFFKSWGPGSHHQLLHPLLFNSRAVCHVHLIQVTTTCPFTFYCKFHLFFWGHKVGGERGDVFQTFFFFFRRFSDNFWGANSLLLLFLSTPMKPRRLPLLIRALVDGCASLGHSSLWKRVPAILLKRPITMTVSASPFSAERRQPFHFSDK